MLTPTLLPNFSLRTLFPLRRKIRVSCSPHHQTSMAGYSSSSLKMKMKRKDLHQVNDDFSDFSLSSPARKIRRLDVDLPPIVEEEEMDMHPVFEQFASVNAGAPAEELASVPANEERAIVLFQPTSSPIPHSPSCFSVVLDSGVISEFKKQLLHSALTEGSESEEDRYGKNNGASSECMAMVPWVPSQFAPSEGSKMETPEFMEAEETGASTMDIEEETDNIVQEPPVQFGNGLRGSQGIQQWQHCMMPQLPQNAPTPIVWYR